MEWEEPRSVRWKTISVFSVIFVGSFFGKNRGGRFVVVMAKGCILLILASGLTPENITEAFAAFGLMPLLWRVVSNPAPDPRMPIRCGGFIDLARGATQFPGGRGDRGRGLYSDPGIREPASGVPGSERL
jgi:hypothetical protein